MTPVSEYAPHEMGVEQWQFQFTVEGEPRREVTGISPLRFVHRSVDGLGGYGTVEVTFMLRANELPNQSYFADWFMQNETRQVHVKQYDKTGMPTRGATFKARCTAFEVLPAYSSEAVGGVRYHATLTDIREVLNVIL